MDSPSTSSGPLPPGGGFLLTPVATQHVDTPDDFTAEQLGFARSALKFAQERVLANADRIERKDFALVRRLLREAGELGLLAMDVGERHGGMALDTTSSMLVAETTSVLGAWSTIVGAQAGIGLLPIVYFGTEAQKERYLPRIGSGEWAAAYALSEASSASDALAARTTAVRSPDGKHWILNGSKQWITNAGFADVFIVFAKVDGDKFSAFIVDRDTPGFTVGAEEHKMGIRGSSTCPLVFEDARIPAENLLGEVGKGHRIAFNILNIGRLKLGVTSVASCRNVLALAASYAVERKAFGKSLSEFGLIREKLARMAATIYVGEAMSYRTTGLIDRRAAGSGAARGSEAHERALIAAVEEYSVEASILKVWGTEALGRAADEGVQIHGGYGFVEEYPIERTYRDVRVYRIFEGTNEINRLLVPGTLMKRAAKGQFPLMELVQGSSAAAEMAPPGGGRLARERRVAERNKALFALAAGAAMESFGFEVAEQQAVMGALADVAIEAYAVDSAVARALQSTSPDPVADACVKLYAEEAHLRAWSRAREALLGSVVDPARARARLAELRRLLDEEPGDVQGWRETIAAAVVEKGRYPLAWA